MKTPEEIAQQHEYDVREALRIALYQRLVEAVKMLADVDVTEADFGQDDQGYYWTWDTIYRLRPDRRYTGARISRRIGEEWIEATSYETGYGMYGHDQPIIATKPEHIALAISYFNDRIQRLQKKKKRGLFGR